MGGQVFNEITLWPTSIVSELAWQGPPWACSARLIETPFKDSRRVKRFRSDEFPWGWQEVLITQHEAETGTNASTAGER